MSLMSAIFIVRWDALIFNSFPLPYRKVIIIQPYQHMLRPSFFVKTTCSLTLTIPSIDFIIEAVSTYKTLTTVSRRGVRKGFLMQCQGKPGKSTHIGTIGDSSSGQRWSSRLVFS